MPQSYDAIYLSPHLDDAALSCGGQIHRACRQGQRVLVLTLMAGVAAATPLAEQLAALWGLEVDEIVPTRRREDAAACGRLGAALLHLDLPEAIYRLHPVTGAPLYPGLGELRGDLQPADSGLLERLEQHLHALPPHRRLLAPLALGGHVDHRLVRAAAEALGSALDYYEDFPYVMHRFALAKVLGLRLGWRSQRIELGPEDVQARVDAARCYDSQLRSLDPERVERQLRALIGSRGGERLWSRTRRSQ